MQMFYIHSFSLIEFLNISKVFLFVFKANKRSWKKKKRKICLIPYSVLLYRIRFNRKRKKNNSSNTLLNRLCAFHHFILFRLIPHFWIMVRLVDYVCALHIPLYIYIYIIRSTLCYKPCNLENILKINFEEKLFFHFTVTLPYMNEQWMINSIVEVLEMW